jgi:hypothetical protein
MLRTWIALTSLAVESQQVMWLRTLKFMAGGPKAERESVSMVTEKLEAAQQAAGRLILGASPESVIRGYRSKVRANRRRLSK